MKRSAQQHRFSWGRFFANAASWTLCSRGERVDCFFCERGATVSRKLVDCALRRGEYCSFRGNLGCVHGHYMVFGAV